MVITFMIASAELDQGIQTEALPEFAQYPNSKALPNGILNEAAFHLSAEAKELQLNKREYSRDTSACLSYSPSFINAIKDTKASQRTLSVQPDELHL